MTGVRAGNAIAAICCAVLAIVSLTAFVQDTKHGGAVRLIADRYQFDLRRAEVAQSIGLTPSADIAADLVGDTALRDVLFPVNLNGLSPAARAAWIDLAGHADEELRDAKGLMLSAVALRPGWPYHQTLLAQIEFESGRRTLAPTLVTNFRKWQTPFLHGASAAPADIGTWQWLALAYLQTWPDLQNAFAPTAEKVFARAFEDEQFVKNTFTPAAALIGQERIIRLLPDSPAPLRQAVHAFMDAGDTDHAWVAYRKWETAEWNARGRDLAAIEKEAQSGDSASLVTLCEQWMLRHSVWDFDSPASRKQAARLLAAWPLIGGVWNTDRRQPLVQYLLAGREDSVDPAVLARSIDVLSGVPPVVRAEVSVLAGDIQGAERLARADEGSTSLAWSAYANRLAWYHVKRRDYAAASNVVTALNPSGGADCEGQTILRAVNGSGTADDEAIVVPQPSMAEVRMMVCFPGKSAAVRVGVETNGRAMLEYGWDGARSATTLVQQGLSTVEIPAPTRVGRHVLHLRTGSIPFRVVSAEKWP